jgi:hypothetical protein
MLKISLCWTKPLSFTPLPKLLSGKFLNLSRKETEAFFDQQDFIKLKQEIKSRS